MLQVKECTPTPSPFIIFTFGLVVESIKGFRGVSQFMERWAITCVAKYHTLVDIIPLSNFITIHRRMALGK
jgi:hypothetical protein